MDYKGKLALAIEDYERQLEWMHISLRELEVARLDPLQDDWDDALNIASYQLAEAEMHIDRAIWALKGGA